MNLMMAGIARLEGDRRAHNLNNLTTLQRCPFTRASAEFITRKTLLFVAEVMEHATQPLLNDYLPFENKDLKDQMALDLLGKRCACR
jgi:hypothetical protein